jgi:RHS repeat-associated protein
MHLPRWSCGLLLGVVLVGLHCTQTYAQLSISSISPPSGPVGSVVTITGLNFGTSQGTSTISLNGTNAVATTWTDTVITALVPFGASSGVFSTVVNGEAANSSTFTVTALPSGWSDSDVGPVGIAGSASYANGIFTVKGSGQFVGNTNADQCHFAYQGLSGDGTIVARVVSASGTTSNQVGLMIRETLSAGATMAFVDFDTNSYGYFYYRTTTGASGTYNSLGAGLTLPYWLKLVRSGNTFTPYSSTDGVNWTAIASETITMAQNVYVGLAVESGSNSTLSTATFDNVSISPAASPAPVITNVSNTTGSIGSQTTIVGTGFGAAQGGSLVQISNVLATVNSWSSTSITITIPTGATSGPLVVCLAPSMNDSNPWDFTVTGQPLPTSWLDQDIGSVPSAGSASYAGGVFTVTASGSGPNTNNDKFHFVYQPLSGDGTIVARVTSEQGSYPTAGVMIRETLTSPATEAYTNYYNKSGSYFYYRSTTGGTPQYAPGPYAGMPYWLKLTRSGNTFTGFASSDGVNWYQLGLSQTITMATNAFIGLAVTGAINSGPVTASFDNVSVSSTTSPAPVISGVSSTTGTFGSAIAISGSGFGDFQGSSLVTLNGSPVTISSWSATAIVITIPNGATSGPLVVTVAPTMNESNPVVFTITSQPLPPGVSDQDVTAPVNSAFAVPGSSTYANNVFTVVGAGGHIGGSSDQMHFVYEPLIGDGSIVARLTSLHTSTSPVAGVMIRETLNTASTDAFMLYQGGYILFWDRPSTGANTVYQGANIYLTLPYWMKVVRSGNSFSGYISSDGVNWVQQGSTLTITMAQSVFIGLAVDSGSNTTLTTATFDNVSINSTTTPAPVITSVSATTGSVGSQIAIGGSGFGASQSTSLGLLANMPLTINSWSNTSIVATIPSGATSGPLVVSVEPSMNDSNPIDFTVTTQPLPTPWLDQDVGQVAAPGSASYSGGVFTITAEGLGSGVADRLHFIYQPMPTDATIVARVVSLSGAAGSSAVVMVRETLAAGATDAYVGYSNQIEFWDRSTTGGGVSYQISGGSQSLPYWVKVVRSGSTFAGYRSTDGINWVQIGSSVTISMAQNYDIGLAVFSGSNTASATATFDNVSLTIGTTPFVTGLSPVLGGLGSSVVVSGSHFGASQGTSVISFNGVAASTITNWSDSQITAAVPASASTGPVAVTVNSIQSLANPIFNVIHPIITSILPPAAQVSDLITVNGSGFGANPVVTSAISLNGVTDPYINTWSDTTITLVVPMATTSGPVVVTENGVASNAVQFTVLEALTVTGVSPSSGMVGSTATISGTGFGPTQSNSVATFDGVPATVTGWSDTAVTVVVPAGASTGPVTVKVGGVTALGPTFTLSDSIVLTDSLGHQSTYGAVLAGGKWYVNSSQGAGCSSCTVRGTIQKQYDNHGNITQLTDELGNVTSYTYDPNDNVTLIKQPAVGGTNPQTNYTYNSFGEVLTVRDALGNTTSNTYDAKGNLLTVTTPAPNNRTAASVTQFAYNSLGELTQITDPLGHATTLTYTTAGLIASITDPQQNVTSYQYDAHGNRTSVTDALNHQTTFAYDTGDRLTTITYPGGSTTTFTYDYRGRRTSVTDQNGKKTSYAYDDADRLTSVTDAASNVTQYAYDTENNLLSITDANSHTTSFAYDAYGRVTETTFPSTHYEQYAYDATNNLTSRTDRKGQTIQYVYDALNRLTQKTYPDSTSVEYVYDLAGKLQQVSDPTGTYGFAYDNMGRLVGGTTQYTFVTGTYSNSYTYDAASNRVSLTDPQNGVTTYAYDTLNRLNTLTPPTAFGIGSFGFTYDALSRRTQVTRPNGVATNYTYDNLSRLLSVLHQLSGSTIDGSSYTVDPAGNRTAKTDQHAGVTSNYTYDPLYELTQVTQNANTTESYTYDPVGNRLSSLGVSPYVNNPSNQLTSTPNASYSYDYNGNITGKTDSTGTTNYTWDFDNRLTQVTLPGSSGTATFKYDPFGRRIQKIFAQGSTTATTNFVYDGDRSLLDIDQNGNLLARYAQSLNTDEPLAESRTGTTNYYEADGLGSVSSLSGSSGALANTYTYDSFGKLVASTGSITNRFQYTAREFDSETGLYFYRARYYDPTSGRFMSEDPIGTSGGLNLYVYVKNDPNDMIDPNGLQRQKPKPPEPSPSSVYFICCKKGQLGICETNLGQNVPPSIFVRDCENEHEKKHLDDFKHDCPLGTKTFCADKPNNFPVAVNPSDQAKVECGGYCAELKCLESKGPWPEVRQRKIFVEGQIKKFCGATGCPK